MVRDLRWFKIVCNDAHASILFFTLFLRFWIPLDFFYFTNSSFLESYLLCLIFSITTNIITTSSILRFGLTISSLFANGVCQLEPVHINVRFYVVTNWPFGDRHNAVYWIILIFQINYFHLVNSFGNKIFHTSWSVVKFNQSKENKICRITRVHCISRLRIS